MGEPSTVYYLIKYYQVNDPTPHLTIKEKEDLQRNGLPGDQICSVTLLCEFTFGDLSSIAHDITDIYCDQLYETTLSKENASKN